MIYAILGLLGLLAVFRGFWQMMYYRDSPQSGFVLMTIGLLFYGFGHAADSWKDFREGNKHEEMMETCFDLAPQLETTLENLQAEISKWEGNKEKFMSMRDAAQTGGGRSLAEEKLARIGEVLNKLKGSHNKVLEQVEIIALESEGQFTELDRKTLEGLRLDVDESVRHARELREGLSNGR